MSFVSPKRFSNDILMQQLKEAKLQYSSEIEELYKKLQTEKAQRVEENE